jgi:hypothetical protein
LNVAFFEELVVFMIVVFGFLFSEIVSFVRAKFPDDDMASGKC